MNSEEQSYSLNMRCIRKCHFKELCPTLISILTAILMGVVGGLGIYFIFEYEQMAGNLQYTCLYI